MNKFRIEKEIETDVLSLIDLFINKRLHVELKGKVRTLKMKRRRKRTVLHLYDLN